MVKEFTSLLRWIFELVKDKPLNLIARAKAIEKKTVDLKKISDKEFLAAWIEQLFDHNARKAH